MTQSEYSYSNSALSHAHAYLLPKLTEILERLPGKRIFDLGCGNGSVANYLAGQGYEVTGIDSSEAGIAQAHRNFPLLRLQQGSTYDDLRAIYGQYPVVMSLEVVEHLYDPRGFALNLFDMVEIGGVAILSTPYHGYIKNLALAVSGKMDAHFTALWDHGHIKFWSMKSLRALLEEVGFIDITFDRVGRVPLIAKSMIAVAHKPFSR